MKYLLTVLVVLSVATSVWAMAPATQPASVQAVASGSAETVIVAVAGSDNADPKAAAIEATNAAIAACGGQAKGLVVFEDSKDPAAVAAAVAEAGKGLPTIGCHGESLVSDRTLKVGAGVAVMAFGGKKVACQTAMAELDKDREKTAAGIVEQLKGLKDPRLVLVLSESDLSFEPGVTVEGFLHGMKKGFGETPIFGGNCKSVNREGVEIKDGKVYKRQVVAMAVSGPFKALGDHTTEFPPVGKPVKVTKADGKWVLELDGKPAGQVYREIRGMKPEDKFTPDGEHAVGVIVAPNRQYNRMVLEWRDAAGNVGPKARTVPEAERYGIEVGKEQALRFVTAIPEGSMVQIMGYKGTWNSITDSAKESVADMLQRAGSLKPLAVMTSDCCTRGSRIKKFATAESKDPDEVKGGILPALKDQKVPVLGFYAYGEIGPIRGEFEGLNYQYQQHTFVGLMLVAE